MSEDQTTKPAPDGTAPPPDPDQLSDEDLQKVSGGMADTFQSHYTGVKFGGGVDESAPVKTEPSPAIRDILSPK